jgi:tetratricopeptide (TPR) repeat protein
MAKSHQSRRDSVRPPLAPGKLWLFRLTALFGIPLLLFVLLELGLRLMGLGYPTAFLLRAEIKGQPVFISNHQFTWRFLGPQQARAPQTLALPRPKAPGTIRIFVLGESAADGDPQPDFGLSRMLQALLRERYPQAQFEVVNAAMTAINSHVILPIARDCARAEGDLWVIYMGNNEVVGPFGAGTVFGSQTPPRTGIRAQLALKTTRTGQTLDGLLRWLHPPPANKTEWGGMLMFLEHQVTADDARLPRMYQHFESNLRDIIHVGERAGAKIVVSTVAVNLRESAPFASQLPERLNGAEQNLWRGWFQRGVEAQASGNFSGALEAYGRAQELTDAVAELAFRQGQCWLALSNAPQAQPFFVRARNLDTLRFRCDDRLNQIVRAVTQAQASQRVVLADAEAEFARHAPAGLPGAEFFYEHVHLTFAGNYLLARTIAAAAEPLLPEAVRAAGQPEWASLETCAARLGWSDWAELEALTEILGRRHDPPFTQQCDHAAQMQQLTTRLTALRHRGTAALLAQAEARGTAALERSPDDPLLLARQATVLEARGQLEAALTLVQRVTELWPHSAAYWGQVGKLHARLNQRPEALAALTHALELDPQNVFTRQGLAHLLTQMNRPADARRELETIIALKPVYGTAHLSLGQLLEAAGDPAGAEKHYAKARQHRVNRPADLAILARFCLTKGWLADAATNFNYAVRLNPTDAALRVEAGRCAVMLERFDEAREHFATAVALNPEFGEAHYRLGRELGRAGDSAGAAKHFGIAAKLLPDLVEARLNHGIALMNLGRGPEAAAEFEAVLQRQPANELARQHLLRLRGETTP